MSLRLSEEHSLSLATLGLIGLILAVTAYDQPQSFGSLSIDTVVVGVPLVILLCIPYVRRVGIASVPRYLLGSAVLVFLGWGLVSVVATGGGFSAWLTMARYASYFLLAVVISIVTQTPAARRLLLWVMAISSGLTAVLSLAQYLDPKLTPGMRGVGPDITTRVVATFYNSNFYAEYLILMIGVVIALAFTEKPRARILAAAVGLLLGVSLLLTYTRGSWLGLVVGLLVFVIVADARYLFAVAAAAGAGVLFVPGVVSRLKQSTANSSSADFRLGIWKIAGQAIRNHPVFGYGAGDFLGAYREVVVQQVDLYQGYVTFGAHNSYFELAAEIGIIGGIAFFVVTFLYATRGIYIATRKGVDATTKYTALGLSVGLVGILANTFTSNTFQHPQSGLFFWILSGIVAGLGAGLWESDVRVPASGSVASDGVVGGSAAVQGIAGARGWLSRAWRTSVTFATSAQSRRLEDSWIGSSWIMDKMLGPGTRSRHKGD